MNLKQRKKCIITTTQLYNNKATSIQNSIIKIINARSFRDFQLLAKLAFNKGKLLPTPGRAHLCTGGPNIQPLNFTVSLPFFLLLFLFLIYRQRTFLSQRHITAHNCQVTLHFLHYRDLAKSAAIPTIHWKIYFFLSYFPSQRATVCSCSEELRGTTAPIILGPFFHS